MNVDEGCSLAVQMWQAGQPAGPERTSGHKERVENLSRGELIEGTVSSRYEPVEPREQLDVSIDLRDLVSLKLCLTTNRLDGHEALEGRPVILQKIYMMY